MQVLFDLLLEKLIRRVLGEDLETQKGIIALFQSSGQDGGIGRNPSLPCTTKRG